MTQELAGRRAVVTGGGSGIGEGIVLALRAAGASVLVVDMDRRTAADVHADVSTDEGVHDTFLAVSKELGGLDLMVNNVGVAGPGAPVDAIDADAFDECVRINLGSAFRCTRAAGRGWMG